MVVSETEKEKVKVNIKWLNVPDVVCSKGQVAECELYEDYITSTHGYYRVHKHRDLVLLPSGETYFELFLHSDVGRWRVARITENGGYHTKLVELMDLPREFPPKYFEFLKPKAGSIPLFLMYMVIQADKFLDVVKEGFGTISLDTVKTERKG